MLVLIISNINKRNNTAKQPTTFILHTKILLHIYKIILQKVEGGRVIKVKKFSVYIKQIITKCAVVCVLKKTKKVTQYIERIIILGAYR